MSIVIGLGLGDEGKGLVTSWLCSQAENPLVVRFNGGHQAGHTVVHNDHRHIFSNFGSGTLQGAPTYWSEGCTFDPIGCANEYELLKEFNPALHVHPFCGVTTPWEVALNQRMNSREGHGSVGVGFGLTIEREEKNYHLVVQDLFYPKILSIKMEMIHKHYSKHAIPWPDMKPFYAAVDKIRSIIKLQQFVSDLYHGESGLIFEGAQGILLDKDFGFFPHVTRSNTTSKEAMANTPRHEILDQEIYYVTRSYLTRHGAGPLPGQNDDMKFINNLEETNVENEHQGRFRTAPLDPELMNYALQCDNYFSRRCKKNIVITCMDQYKIDVDALLGKLNTKFEKVFISYGPSATDIKQYR